MKVRIHYRSPLLLLVPRWVCGVTLGRHIFFRRERGEVSARSLRHELIHVAQYAEHGFRGFLWQYLWRERRQGYRQKSFEQEAFAHEDDPDYCRSRWSDQRLELPHDLEG